MSGCQALSYARRRPNCLSRGTTSRSSIAGDQTKIEFRRYVGPGLVDLGPDKICFQEERPEGVIRPFRGPLRSVEPGREARCWRAALRHR